MILAQPGPDIAPPEWVASGERVACGSGRRLFVRVAGAGAIILLLHGYPSWSWDWSRIARRSDGEAMIVTPDLLGFGHSDKPRQRYSIDEQANLIEGLLRHLNIDAVHLVAHEYGTIVAQELLHRRRQKHLGFKIKSLTLLNAAIVADLHRPSLLHRILSAPVVGALVARLASTAMWRQSLQRVAGKGYQIGNQEFAAFWSGNAQGGDPVQLHRMLRYIAERRRNRDRWEGALAAFDAPLQLVWGMHDPLSGAHVLREARQRYPNASAVELPGVGHWPQLEAPERVAAAIRDFVKNHV